MVLSLSAKSSHVTPGSLSVCLIELLLGSFYCVQHDTTSQSQVLLSETEGRVHIVRSCLSPPISCQSCCYSSLKGDDFRRHFRYRFSTYTLLRPATQNKPVDETVKLMFKISGFQVVSSSHATPLEPSICLPSIYLKY